MTANLLFSQAPYQTQPPDIERGMMGGPVQNPSAVTKIYDGSSGDSHESFLNALEQISKDHKPDKQTQGADGGKPTTSPAHNSGDKFDATSRPATDLETGISETTKQPEEYFDNVESQITPDSDLLAVIGILEKLGLYDSAGGSSSANKVDGILDNAEGLAALKTLIARLGQNDFVPSAEMKAELDRLQQFIANAQTGNTPSGNDGNPLGELTDSRSTKSVNLNQSAENAQAASISENREKTDSIKLAVEAQTVEVEASENAKGPRSLETVRTDASGLRDGSDTQGKTDAPSQAGLPNRISSTIDSGKQFGGDSTQQTLPKNESSSVIKVTPDAQAVKTISEGQRYTGETVQDNTVKNGPPAHTKMTNDAQAAKALSQGQRHTGDPIHENRVHNDASLVSKITNDTQAAKAISQGQRYAGETVQDNTVNNESSPVIKMIHDSQLAKENHIRMNAAMGDEFGGKVTKVDAGANDNGLLNSQNQTAEKAFEATSLSKLSDTGQDSLRTQTLDQIVRKAVIYMRNGQHEAKIDLKPEFLGRLRMQVTTENHQVTVKILTEFGFVKDMVENNIQQLKADLQRQGLNVDKLEVAVSNDSDEYEHPQEKADQTNDRQRSVARINPGSREGESREPAGNSGLRKAGTTTVDYFA